MANQEMEPREQLDSEAIRTEYIQAGEEARYRHKLMQNSYYLILILNGAFAGALSSNFARGDWLVLTGGSGLAFISILFLSITIHVNGSKRGAAWSRRQFIEENAPHEWYRIQRDTIKRRAKFRMIDGGRKYAPREKTWLENLRSDRIPYFFAINSMMWMVFGIWAMGNHIGF